MRPSASRCEALYWTDIYLNHNEMNGETNAHLQNIFGHESGHGMGLFHNTTTTNSLMYATLSNIGSPQAVDLGAYPGCSGGGASDEGHRDLKEVSVPGAPLWFRP